MDEITKDSRFSHVLKDPRFKKLPKKHVKVKIDKRFQSMFSDKKFQVKCSVDKRGRKVQLGGSEDLKRFYELSESGSDDDEEDETEDEEDKSGNEKDKKKESVLSSSSEKEDEKQDESIIKASKKEKEALGPKVKKKLRDLTIDYARGEGAIFSDSSSDEESSDLEDDEDEFVHNWGELDKDAETTETATNRLAVCHMNWDRIEAVDLMVLFNSFLPPGGLINSIIIYPSEFGLQRMKEEDEKGPPELIKEPLEGEEDEADKIQMEKLRKYQLNRLKYYYAVIVCDKAETADVLYKECDGLEYESSSNKLDLRFIPDDTVFDQEPKESCTSLPDLSTYKPKLFMTSALTKSKCELTWDETDPNRENVVKSIHSGNIEESQIKKYLACSSSEESENEAADGSAAKENTKGLGDIEKYKALLAEVENKEKNNKKNEVNLEVSWNLKLENKANEMVKEAAKEKDKKTPFQQYLEKRKEKKKKKQEQRKAADEEAKEDSAFSDDDIPSDIDLNDPYFKEEFESMKSKKSAKKKKHKEESDDEESKQRKGELELLMLDNEPENLKHFSLKKIEKSEKLSENKKLKGKKRKLEEINDFKDNFKIDVNDERFSALYTSHHFNIDPADPQFKPTKATKDLIEEKLRRRESGTDVPSKKSNQSQEATKSKSKNAELSLLVKNIKKNTSEAYKKTRLK